jgi:hypothetical protein
MSWANDAKGAEGIAFGPLLIMEFIGVRHTILNVKRTGQKSKLRGSG